MAFLPGNDKQLDDDQQQQQTQGGQPNIAGSAGFSGPQQSNVVGSGTGVSTAGVGKGGTGGWTNVQAYINANKNYNSGAEQGIRSQVGQQFDKERETLDKEKQNVSGQVQGQVNKVNEAKQNYGSWVDQAAQNYQYGAQNQNQAYQDYFSKLQNSLNAKYEGPESVSYQRSADTQRYGDALQDDGGYRNLVNEFYKNQGGGRLSSGQRALQDQLDVNNIGLQNAKKDLQGKYQQLGEYENQAIGDIQNQITGAKETIGNFDLKNLLQNDAARLNQSIAEQEAQAKHDYEKAYRGGSGLGSVAQDISGIYTIGGGGGVPTIDMGGAYQNALANAGLYSGDMTFDQLQRERDSLASNAQLSDLMSNGTRDYIYNRSGGNVDVWGRKDRNASALDKFYGDQDAKYADVADIDERKWNLIQDLFGSQDPRKAQGFKVRG